MSSDRSDDARGSTGRGDARGWASSIYGSSEAELIKKILSCWVCVSHAAIRYFSLSVRRIIILM